MSSQDAFAFKNASLDAFLFAEVGIELNGSPLTILSVLARLGQDPWAEAAKWAKLPKAATIDRLAESISQMPLPPQAIHDAHSTASQLIQLLPPPVALPGEKPKVTKSPMPRWALVVICCVALALGIAFTLLPARPAAGSAVPMSDLHAGHASDTLK